MTTKPSRSLETFPHPRPGRNFVVSIDCPEFTCLCPKTGQPDFAHHQAALRALGEVRRAQVAQALLLELPRRGAFHEAVVHQILDDLVAALAPRWLRVEGDFYVRGGLHTRVFARHGRLPDDVGGEPPL